MRICRQSDLHKFGMAYCDILNRVYQDFRPLEPIPMINSLICYPFCHGHSPQIELPDKEKIVPFLDELLRRLCDSPLSIGHVKRVRIYERNVILIIKPNLRRYWLGLTAIRDAQRTMIDLLNQGY